MPEIEPENDWKRHLNIRNLTAFLMSAAVAASIFWGKSQERPAADYDELLQRNSSFVIRVVVSEVIVAGLSPDQSSRTREQVIAGVHDRFDMLQTRFRKGSDIFEIQKFMILDFMDTKPDFPHLESPEDPLISDFVLLYKNGHTLDDNSALFDLPTGKLARIRNLIVRGESKKAVELRISEEGRAIRFLGLLMIVSFSALLLFISSIFVVFRFFSRKPPGRFFRVVRHLSGERHRGLLDAFIFYLFLTFPVGTILFSVMKERAEGTMLTAQFVYMAVVFFGVIIYYRSSAGGGLPFKNLFYDEKDFKPFREVLWGLIGFVGIFPIAVLATLFTIGMAGESAGDMRFAHPIVFDMQKDPLMIFLFAVLGAPIIEEVMFRSFLYGFLRKYMRTMPAGFFSGLIFASLHPQGWVALPYLTILGMGLAILREYRTGLVAPVVAHATVNGLAASMVYFIFYS